MILNKQLEIPDKLLPALKYLKDILGSLLFEREHGQANAAGERILKMQK
jgi:hypothetical protein